MWQLCLKLLRKKEARKLFSRYHQVITEDSLLTGAMLPVTQIWASSEYFEQTLDDPALLVVGEKQRGGHKFGFSSLLTLLIGFFLMVIGEWDDEIPSVPSHPSKSF